MFENVDFRKLAEQLWDLNDHCDQLLTHLSVISCRTDCVQEFTGKLVLDNDDKIALMGMALEVYTTIQKEEQVKNALPVELCSAVTEFIHTVFNTEQLLDK